MAAERRPRRPAAARASVLSFPCCSLSVRCTAYTLLPTIGVRRTLVKLMTPEDTHRPHTPEQSRSCSRLPSRSPTRTGSKAFSMRRLAQELGVVPMALYKHVANKDELLDGMVDIVFGEIESPAIDDDWRSAMRRRAISAREALKRHSWAIGLMESRNPGPANLRQPQRGHGLPARGGLLVRDGDPRLLGPGRLHLRLRPAGEDARVPDTQRRRTSRAAKSARPSARFDDYPYLAEIATKLSAVRLRHRRRVRLGTRPHPRRPRPPPRPWPWPWPQCQNRLSSSTSMEASLIYAASATARIG